MFNVIEGGYAIVRKPKGIFIQAKIYHRLGLVYFAASGGFIRIADRFGNRYTTSHPDFYVEEISGAEAEISLDGEKAPRYVG